MSSAEWLTPKLISRLEALELSIKWVKAGNRAGGRFPINRRGSSVEFADYVAYCAGDDIRSIDWNLYARLDRLFVKTYKEEIELSVEIIIDATVSMGLPTPIKFEMAKRLAICLGYIGLIGRHHVRLHWITHESKMTSPWFNRRSDLVRMVEKSEPIKPSSNVSFEEWMRKAVLTYRMHGGQAIILTDGMIEPAEFFRGLHMLLRKNLEVKIVQVLSEEELHPAKLFRAGVLVDAETGMSHQLGYSPKELERAMEQHNQLLCDFCRKNGIAFVRFRIDEPLESFLFHTLPIHGFVE